MYFFSMILCVLLVSGVAHSVIPMDTVALSDSLAAITSAQDSTRTSTRSTEEDSTRTSTRSTEEDSTRIKAEEDSTLQAQDLLREMLYQQYEKQRAVYSRFPTEAIELYNPYELDRYRLSRSDYFAWEDVLQDQPDYTTIRYSPRFPINRALYRGYLFPMGALNEGSLLSQLRSPNIPDMPVEPLGVVSAKLSASGGIYPTYFPQDVVTPELFFVWENGLFDGNVVDLRFVRNITEEITFGVYSSYRSLERRDYYHGNGIGTTYQYAHTDSTKVSLWGRNPYSSSHRSSLFARWEKRSTVNMRYSYSDIREDFVFPTDSSVADTSQGNLRNDAWDEVHSYLSSFSADATVPLGEKFLLGFEGRAENLTERDYPFTRTTRGNLVGEERRGEVQLQAAGGQLSFIPAIYDTLSLSGSVNRHVVQQWDDSQIIAHHSTARLHNYFEDPSQNDRFSLDLSAGADMLRANNSDVEVYPIAEGEITFRTPLFRSELWGKYTIAPPAFLTDTTIHFDPDAQLGDLYVGAGARLNFAHSLFSLTGGYSWIYGIEDHTIASYWQNQTLPYTNPGHVFSIAPSFGEWHGISFTSNWLFSDTYPRIKSTSVLRFHIHREGKSRHFYTDIIYQYWSERGYDFAKTSAGEYLYSYPHWNRPIHDISLKLTAEISTFRIFFKMDNLLNRTNSYLPGYFMPGLTFRWGFAWTIFG